MKANINGYEIECSVEEFRQLTTKEEKSKEMPELKVKRFRKHHLSNSFKGWTKDEDFLIKSGIRISTLAKRLGRTQCAIYARRSNLKKKGD